MCKKNPKSMNNHTVRAVVLNTTYTMKIIVLGIVLFQAMLSYANAYDRIVMIKCLGDVEGVRYLNGHTETGKVELVADNFQTNPNYSGTKWQITEEGFIKCLGDVEGSRYLNGHTETGKVELVADNFQTNQNYSGTKWQLITVTAPSSDCTASPKEITVVDASQDISKSPVIFNNNTFTLNFPSYCEPVDIYFAIAAPDNKLIFIDSNGKLTLDFLPYTAGAKSAIKSSFSVADSALATEITGKCMLYWLAAPANGGDILGVINDGTYEFGFYNFDGNVVTGELRIVSVDADNFIPFAPIKINIEDVNKEISDIKNFRVVFNDIEVPVYSVSDDLRVIETFIPYILGNVSIKFNDGKNITSNEILVLIENKIPSAAEIAAVESKVINDFEIMVTDIQQQSAQQNLSAESSAAYAEIENEIKAIKMLCESMLSKMFSKEEREQFSSLMINSGAINLNDSKAKRSGNTFSSFNTSLKYESVMSTRKILESSNRDTAILDFDIEGELAASLYKPVAVLLTVMKIGLAIQKGATQHEPSLLESFTVTINEPTEGFYRNSVPLPTTKFVGTFVGMTIEFEAISSMLATIAWEISSYDEFKKDGLLNEMLSTALDGWMTTFLKQAIAGDANIDAIIEDIKAIFKNIGEVKKYDNVEFNIKDFQSTMVDISGGDAGGASWNKDNGEIEPSKPGSCKFKFTIIDTLKPNDSQLVDGELIFTIKNHIPELKSTPTCVVDKNGECNFVLDLTDKDNESDEIDQIFASIDEGGEPQAGSCTGTIEKYGFEYSFNKYKSPIANDLNANVEPGKNVVINLEGFPATDIKSDSVRIKYGDQYENTTVDVNIDLSAVYNEFNGNDKYKRVNYHIAESPKMGTLQPIINGNQLVYEANQDAEKEDFFTYWVEYEGKTSEPATVTISLTTGCNSDFTKSLGMNFVKIENGSETYCMQTTEVTQGQWAAVMGSNPSYFTGCGENCPVEQVSWDDAQVFIAALNAKGEGTYSLPTEAQWEYAARAGSTTDFANGDMAVEGYNNYYCTTPQPNLDAMGWYCGNSAVTYQGCVTLGHFRECVGSHSVAQKTPNAWDLYDMHGNVWEWCQDLYASSGSYRVVRGGSWNNSADYCRSAARSGNYPDGRDHDIGFRLVRLP
ncbi:MAG: formylglycine-generating enzyme family protein [Desulfamplus sp.]|nr:formylglycine-generating enzyme family protein [Desulfamplus sp.]